MEVKTVIERFEGTITAITPICHIDKQFGVVSTFNREKMLINGKIEAIPCYSGNSIRGILRRCIYEHLLKTLDVKEKQLNKNVIFALKMGGQLRRGEAASFDTDFECTIRAKLPYVSLLGTAVKQQLIHGKLNVGIAYPIAKETLLQTGVKSDVSVWDLLDRVQMTRRDDREQKKGKGEDEEKEQAEQMLYKVEVLIPGTQLKHGFTLKDANETERACFMRMLKEFQDTRMQLGGDARVGMGKITWTYTPEESLAYDSWLEENSEGVKDYLLGELAENA